MSSGPPILSLAGHGGNDCVIYAGTLSKALSAGVRTGYLVLPPHLVSPAVAAKQMANHSNPWLDRAILASFVGSGSFQRHIRVVRKSCSDLLEHLIASLRCAFGEVELFGVQSGMHVMWRLPAEMPRPAELEQRARAHGVSLYTLSSGGVYDQESSYGNECVLLGYAALTKADITKAVQILSSIRTESCALQSAPTRQEHSAAP